jgi:hypothetical protein
MMLARFPAVATVALTIGVLTAFTPVPLARADQGEDFFLQELRRTQQKWIWPGQEDWILGKGHEICDDWANGVAYPDEVELVVDRNAWWTHRNARFFIDLSTRALCPQYYLAKIPDPVYAN